MTHRRSNVYLSHAEPRCEPSQQCDRKSTCARYLAQLPPSSAKIEDFSLSPLGLPWFKPECSKWISAQDNKPLQQPPVIRRRPPIGSGS